MRSNTARFCFDDNVSCKFANQHQNAIPESLVWKTTTGKPAPYIGTTFVCPHHNSLDHFEFTKEEIAAEQQRTNLLYRMLCEDGMQHVEDLWRAYLGRRSRMEAHPFDGFDHFYQYIADRAHIFGMDRTKMVYNQSMLVTLAVLRYAHALLHGTPVERAPALFSSETSGLFYRAFLAFMDKDDLSCDAFFSHFPAIFTFDWSARKEWTLNKASASAIPSAFDPSCLPQRDITRVYVDRSQIFNGIGRVVANNVAHIKIQSEETLRKGMSYFVGVPLAVADDAAKYTIGTRVAYTAVRAYNDTHNTLHGTSIQLEKEEKDKTTNDGTISDFWSFKDDGLEEKTVQKIAQVETGPIRLLDVRCTVAERERAREAAITRLAKDWIGVEQLWFSVASLVDAKDYLKYFEQRPFLYAVSKSGDGKTLVKARSASVRAVVQDYLCSLAGKSVSKTEAVRMCTARNECLPDADRFRFEDLKQCIRVDKLLLTKEDGTMAIQLNVEPLVYWNREHEMMMRI